VTRRERLVLLASTVGFSMVLLDTTVVNVALGSIARDLSAGPTTLEWIANAYTLVFAGLLLSTGLAADRVGARTVFLAGLGTFAAGSVAATLAPSAAALVAAQAVLGVGAALVLPTSLSLLSQVFEDPACRVRAVGVWAAGSAVSFATGPVLGGVLIEQAGWRSIFVINLPLAAIAAALVLTQVGARRAEDAPAPAPLNLGAQAATIAMLLALTFGLVESGDSGWGSPRVVIALLVAAALAVGLVRRERTTDRPLVPRALVADRRFTGATAGGALLNFAFYGELFFLSLFLQQDRGLDALETGLAFLPQPLFFIAVAPLATRMLARGTRVPLAVGAGIAVVGSLILLGVDTGSPYGVLMAALALNGIGGGFAIPAVTATVMSAAPTNLAGVASASLNAGRQVGGVLGVAVLGGMATAAGHVDIGAMHNAAALAALGLAAASALSLALRPPRVRAARDAVLAGSRAG
jgi:MFS transporter, DHA2 family, methylenomycin A resistance protein